MEDKAHLKIVSQQNDDPAKTAWQNVVLENTPPTGNVRPEVLRSWHQSKKNGIDPYSNDPPQRISENKLKRLFSINKTLIEIAKPVMQMIEISVRDTGFLTTLAEKSGYVLLVVGESDIIEMSNRNYYVPGCRRNCKHAGTNAIGLCLQENKPIQLTGYEHYRVKHHDWTCSSAPIIDNRGDILGVITLSGRSKRRHQHTLALVTAAAEAIETQLRERELIEEKQLLNSLVSSIFNSMTDGLIALDSNLTITHLNSQAQKMLSIDRSSALGQQIFNVIRPDEILVGALQTNSNVSSMEIDFHCPTGQRSYICSVDACRDASRHTLGNIIRLVKKRDVINITKKFGGNYAKYEFEDIKGKDSALLKQIELARITAKTNSKVLIFGESGTGKELFAQAIHNHSSRRRGPFLAISCATIPRDLFESELFGYRPGAYTGARQDGMIGKFELAHQGSLFLDEINALPLDIQAKLLRVLQQGVITRLGDTRSIPIDVRVIAATNADLLTEVENNNFREDLYYRVNVVEIFIPPLRERKGDLGLLVSLFLDRLCEDMAINKPKVSDEVLDIFRTYCWPGNVRELENCIERAVVLSQGDEITKQHLPERLFNKPTTTLRTSSTSFLDGYKDMIEAALERNNGNASQAARELNIARSTLYRKMKEFDIT
jgi:sigma-54 dependent transcriptional regulator, acetoin dehydrogenase operon transcriptional activator AcoR